MGRSNRQHGPKKLVTILSESTDNLAVLAVKNFPFIISKQFLLLSLEHFLIMVLFKNGSAREKDE